MSLTGGNFSPKASQPEWSIVDLTKVETDGGSPCSRPVDVETFADEPDQSLLSGQSEQNQTHRSGRVRKHADSPQPFSRSEQ